jgi:hypothetical protein
VRWLEAGMATPSVQLLRSSVFKKVLSKAN